MANVLVAVGEAADPTPDPKPDWAGIFATELSAPDNALTVYATTAQQDGREMVTGAGLHHEGIMIRVRGVTSRICYAKAQSVWHTLNESIYQRVVTIDAVPYLVWGFSKVKKPNELGKESPSSARFLATINALVSLRALA